MLPKPSVIYIDGRAKPWRVTYRQAGKRRTAHYKTKGEAAAFAREQGIEEANPDLAVTTEERLALVRLRRAAAATQVSLDDVVDAAIEIARKRSAVAIEIPTAIRLYLEDCQRRNLRPATLSHYSGMLDRFARSHSGLVCDLVREQASDWICASYQSEESRTTARTPLMAWLRWCGRQGYADVARWRDPLRWHVRLSDDRKIGILRPAELRLILNRLPTRLRAPVAICAFSGIRPKGELERLEWSMIDRRRRVVELPGSATKIRRGRTLHNLPVVFWQWVEWERRRVGKLEGKVLPITYRNFRTHVRATDIQWPPDATRHSFASYGYHVLGLEHTVELMGHIGGFRVFSSRYKAAASAWTAGLWFAVSPPRSEISSKTSWRARKKSTLSRPQLSPQPGV